MLAWKYRPGLPARPSTWRRSLFRALMTRRPAESRRATFGVGVLVTVLSCNHPRICILSGARTGILWSEFIFRLYCDYILSYTILTHRSKVLLARKEIY